MGWHGKKKEIYITHGQTERGEMKRNGRAASPRLWMGAYKAGVGGWGGWRGCRRPLDVAAELIEPR